MAIASRKTGLMSVEGLSGPFRNEGAFSSFTVANTRGTTALDGHVGFTIHVSGGSRIERRCAGRTRLFLPQVASSFIDTPGNTTEIVIQGRAAILQGKMAVDRLQLIAAEDHDCVLKLDTLASGREVSDFDLLRLAVCSTRAGKHLAVVERELVRRLVHLTGGRAVDWKGGLPPARLLRLERLVRDRFRDVTVGEMAETVDLTLHHFSREFKRATGNTPWAYVIEWKLKKAVDLLRLTSLPVSEVAIRAGFTHASHLSRHMLARLGVTPYELRRTLRA